jgi:hypothetical protein
MMEEPDRAFVVALMDEIHLLLFDPRDDLKDTAVSIIVSLLQQRRNVMSEFLIAEVQRGDRIETIDIMNRGGFGALLVAHEAATYAENISTVPRRSNSNAGSKKKYASFFEWLERNQPQVDSVFGGIHAHAIGFSQGLIWALQLLKMLSKTNKKVCCFGSHLKTRPTVRLFRGLERAELAQRCYDRTAESQLLWKRQGFDDLSSGGLEWKVLLRQLKGSCSIWEGGNWVEERSPLSKKRLMLTLTSKDKDDSSKHADLGEERKVGTNALVTKWKLDLTEGYERQRRRLLPNYEVGMVCMAWPRGILMTKTMTRMMKVLILETWQTYP